MDEYRAARIIVSVIVFSICGYLAYIFLSKTTGNPGSTAAVSAVEEIIDSAKQTMSFTNPISCGVVFGNCEVKIEKEDLVCNPSKLIEEVKKEAANPIASSSCIEAQEKMKSQCGTGCSLLSESLISVPGEVQVEISYIDTQTNTKQILSPGMRVPESSCTAVGRRLINLKADCG